MTAKGPRECPRAGDPGAAPDFAVEAFDGVYQVQLAAVGGRTARIMPAAPSTDLCPCA